VPEMDPDLLALGHRQRREALDTFAECEASGIWPGYSMDVLTIPDYAKRKLKL
jgi:hypothetical protein